MSALCKEGSVRFQDDGYLEVSIGETVFVEIEAKETAFIASIGAISGGKWVEEETRPSQLKEVRRFIVTEAFSTKFSFTTGFDFSPDESGKIPATAKYTIRISGDGPGEETFEHFIEPIGMLPTTFVFRFQVSV